MLNLVKKGPPKNHVLAKRATKNESQKVIEKRVEKETPKKSTSEPPGVQNGGSFFDVFNINELLVWDL